MRNLHSVTLLLGACIALTLPTGCEYLEGIDGFSAGEDFDDVTTTAPPLMTAGRVQLECDSGIVNSHAFDYGLCLCGDLELVGSGVNSQSYSWLLGDDGGLGHVGINGDIDVVGSFDVDGILNVAHGLQGVGEVTVNGDLISGRDVRMTGQWEVGENAMIDGDLSGVGQMSVGETLWLDGRLSSVGSVEYDRLVEEYRYTGLPCACDEDALIDVADEVRAHRDDNDNQLIPQQIGRGFAELGDGDFYFADQDLLLGTARLTIAGNTSIYIEGDLESVGSLNIEVEEGASLSLSVSGGIDTVGSITFNDRAPQPRAFRLYIGGSGVSTVGSATFVGGVYAPNTDFDFVGSLTVEGAMFARSIDGTGQLSIIYDSDLSASDSCIEPLM